MSIFYKPHTATVYRNQRTASSKVETLSGTVDGQLTRGDSEYSDTDYGVKLVETGQFLFDYDDLSKIEVGDKLLLDGSYWRVKALEADTTIFMLSCANALLERLQGNE